MMCIFSGLDLPDIKGTKQIKNKDMCSTDKLCVLSSQYAVIACKNTLSLFELSSSPNILDHLHTLSYVDSRRVVAVAEDKIAVLQGEYETCIKFYCIHDQKITESKEDKDINESKRALDIDFGDETFFVLTYGEILQLSLKGTVLKTFQLLPLMESVYLSYDPNAAKLYVVDRTRMFKMTQKGEFSLVIRNVAPISNMAVTENGNVYMTCKHGLFLMNMYTGEAVHWNIFGECLSYNRRLKKLFVRKGQNVHIVETGKFKSPNQPC